MDMANFKFGELNNQEIEKILEYLKSLPLEISDSPADEPTFVDWLNQDQMMEADLMTGSEFDEDENPFFGFGVNDPETGNVIDIMKLKDGNFAVFKNRKSVLLEVSLKEAIENAEPTILSFKKIIDDWEE